MGSSYDYTNIGATWERPNGRDHRVYDELLRSSRQRLAWEFLRRNPEYQQHSDFVQAGWLHPDVVADAWGMYSFRPWDLAFGERDGNGLGGVRFKQSHVSLWAHKEDRHERHIDVPEGTILFRLNMNEMLLSGDSRAAQLATLERCLDLRLGRYAEEKGVVLPKPTRLRDEHLQSCLQIDDLRYHGVRAKEIKCLVPWLAEVNPDCSYDKGGTLRGGRDTTKVDGRLATLDERRKRMIFEDGYLRLVARAHSKSSS